MAWHHHQWLSGFSANRRLTFSARRLVEAAGPGPPLLADLGPRLLGRPLDGRLVSLLETRQRKTGSLKKVVIGNFEAGWGLAWSAWSSIFFVYLQLVTVRLTKKKVGFESM